MAGKQRFYCPKCGALWDRTDPARGLKWCTNGHEAPLAPKLDEAKRAAPVTATAAPTRDGSPPDLSVLRTISAAALLRKELPEPRWAVPGLVPEGLTLLIGKGKIGKSWWVLGASIAVASGGRALGRVAVEPGPVLYLALEDNERRLQARLRDILGTEQPPDGLELATEWRRLDQGGLALVERWLDAHPGARMVIIDTLARVRGRAGKDTRLYDDDYRALQGLHELAGRRQIAVVVIHHSRKADGVDVLDVASGTTGLTGCADGVLVMRRVRGEQTASLFVTGRDIVDEEDLALRWDSVTMSWILLDPEEGKPLSKERADIQNVLRASPEPLAPIEIAQQLGKSPNVMRVLLHKMVHAGQVAGVGSKYTAPEKRGNGVNGRPETRAGIEQKALPLTINAPGPSVNGNGTINAPAATVNGAVNASEASDLAPVLGIAAHRYGINSIIGE
jgi:hypothetical protein